MGSVFIVPFPWMWRWGLVNDFGTEAKHREPKEPSTFLRRHPRRGSIIVAKIFLKFFLQKAEDHPEQRTKAP